MAARNKDDLNTITRSDKVARYFQRITSARKRRADYEMDWDDLDNMLRGQVDLTLDIEHDLDVNLAHATLQTAIPKVILQNPKLAGRPKRSGAERAAKVMEQVDNYFIDELKMVPEWRKCIADSETAGFGVLKIGYIPPGKDYPETEEPGEAVEAEIDRLEEEMETIAEGGTPAPSGVEPDPAALIDPLKKRGQFFVERVSPRCFLWDPMADDLRQMRWVAHEYIMPVSAIKKEVRFNPRARSKVRGTLKFKDRRQRGSLEVQSGVYTSVDVPGSYKQGVDKDEDFDKLIEIWDWENQKVITIAESCPDVLQEIDWPFPTEGFPFAILRYNITPDEFIPISDLAAGLPQLLELRFLRQKRALHLRRFNRKYCADTDQMGDNAEQVLEELTAGEDGVIVQTNPQFVSPIQDASTSPDYDRHEAAIRSDYREITGQSELERGSGLRGDASATEAALLDANSRMRSTYRRTLTEEFINDTFRILNILLKSFLDGGVVVKITGDPETEGDWFEIKNEDIQGEYDVEVIAGSTLPVTQEVKKRSLLELFTVLGPFIQAGAVPLMPILKEIGEAYGIRDFDRFLGIPEGGTEGQAPTSMPFPMPGPGATGMAKQAGSEPQTDALSAAFGSAQGLGGLSL